MTTEKERMTMELESKERALKDTNLMIMEKERLIDTMANTVDDCKKMIREYSNKIKDLQDTIEIEETKVERGHDKDNLLDAIREKGDMERCLAREDRNVNEMIRKVLQYKAQYHALKDERSNLQDRIVCLKMQLCRL
jgi:phage host-nuclease inhibitor protein Gam